MRREGQKGFLKDALLFAVNFIHTRHYLLIVYPLEKHMVYLDSTNSHPHKGVYYAIIQYLQREYDKYYPGGFWSDFR
jgi:hypothetical protein